MKTLLLSVSLLLGALVFLPRLLPTLLLLLFLALLFRSLLLPRRR